MKQLLRTLPLIAILFLATGSMHLQAGPAAQGGENSDLGLLNLLFGDSIGTVIVNGGLLLLLLRYGPTFLGILKNMTTAAQATNSELFELIKNILVDLTGVVRENTKSNQELQKYIQTQDDMIDKRTEAVVKAVQLVETKVDALSALIVRLIEKDEENQK